MNATLPTTTLRRLILLAVCLGTVTVPTTVTAAASTETNLVVFSEGHLDIRVDYQAERTNQLALLVADEDGHRELPPDQAVLVASEASRVTLSADVPPFGNDGESLWLLPQTQAPGVLFPGFSAERNPANVFVGPLDLQLLAVDGPGHFFLWQANVGALDILMNSRDGIGAEDHFALIIGGHSHFNWGFTSNGIYRLTFQASGQRAGESTNLTSLPTVLTFHVLPLPPEPESAFRQWQTRQWPGVTDLAIIGPEADPDADGQPNLLEYATGSDPTQPNAAVPLTIQATVGPAGSPAELLVRWIRATAATDVDLMLEQAETPLGPWTSAEGTPSLVTEGALTTVTHHLPLASPASPARFFRLRFTLHS